MWKIYVGNLSSRIRELELSNEFRPYGLVRSIWIARNPPGYAFVEFDSRQEAHDAIAALDGKHGWRVEMSRRSLGGIRSRSSNRDTRCRECGSHRHHGRDCRSRSSQRSRKSSSPHSRAHKSSAKRRRSRSRSPLRDDQLNERSAMVSEDSPSQKIGSSKSPQNDLTDPHTDGYHSSKERERSFSPLSGCGRSPDVQKSFESDVPAVSEPDLSGLSEHMNRGNSPHHQPK